MDSKEILPLQKRLTEEKAIELYGMFGEGERFESLVNLVNTYERALTSVENNFYKWRLDKTKYFTLFFKWNRVKENEYVSFGKLQYYAFYDRLKKYIDILPKAESHYEEKRFGKISDMQNRHLKRVEKEKEIELKKKK